MAVMKGPRNFDGGESISRCRGRTLQINAWTAAESWLKLTFEDLSIKSGGIDGWTRVSALTSCVGSRWKSLRAKREIFNLRYGVNVSFLITIIDCYLCLFKKRKELYDFTYDPLWEPQYLRIRFVNFCSRIWCTFCWFIIYLIACISHSNFVWRESFIRPSRTFAVKFRCKRSWLSYSYCAL